MLGFGGFFLSPPLDRLSHIKYSRLEHLCTGEATCPNNKKKNCSPFEFQIPSPGVRRLVRK